MHGSLWAKKILTCWFSQLWMWLWGANSWAHSSDLSTPGDSTPTVLASRLHSGHQALAASCPNTADSGLPSSHLPEDLARSSHRTQKMKNWYNLTRDTESGPPSPTLKVGTIPLGHQGGQLRKEASHYCFASCKTKTMHRLHLRNAVRRCRLWNEQPQL